MHLVDTFLCNRFVLRYNFMLFPAFKRKTKMFTFLLLSEIVIERVSKELLAITNNKLVFFTITQNMKQIIVRARKMAKFYVLIWNKEIQQYLHYQSPNADYKIYNMYLLTQRIAQSIFQQQKNNKLYNVHCKTLWNIYKDTHVLVKSPDNLLNKLGDNDSTSDVL